MWDGGGGSLFELHSALLHPRLPAGEPINALAFDPREEALWAGSEGGMVVQLAVGGADGGGGAALSSYASIAAHADRVIELRALGEGAVSLSSCGLQVHGSGCAPCMAWEDEVRPVAAAALWNALGRHR